jgi:hypothetical protein
MFFNSSDLDIITLFRHVIINLIERLILNFKFQSQMP